MKPRLRIVRDDGPPVPDLSYEWRDRQRIAARNWAAVHVAGDRRAPLHIADAVRRIWRLA